MTTCVPPGLPSKIWLVIRPSGERYFLHQEPMGGAAEWAKGSDVTVVEYANAKLVYRPPTKGGGVQGA